MTAVFVGLGSNIKPQTYVPKALALLERRFRALRISPIYRCPAVGFNGNDFINLVVGFESDTEVHALRDALRELETACGRERGEKYASRTMDIDLLLYGDAVIEENGLHLPRADILDYAFVLKPLADLAPQDRHPVRGQTYAALWSAFDAVDQPLTPFDLDG